MPWPARRRSTRATRPDSVTESISHRLPLTCASIRFGDWLEIAIPGGTFTNSTGTLIARTVVPVERTDSAMTAYMTRKAELR